jgi:hypothetical protein
MSRKRKCIDFDFRLLAAMDESDVAVRHHRLDFEPTVCRDEHSERLSWGDDTAHAVNVELLDHAVDRRRNTCNFTLSFALATSCVRVATYSSAFVRSLSGARRLSAYVFAFVSLSVAIAVCWEGRSSVTPSVSREPPSQKLIHG